MWAEQHPLRRSGLPVTMLLAKQMTTQLPQTGYMFEQRDLSSLEYRLRDKALLNQAYKPSGTMHRSQQWKWS